MHLVGPNSERCVIVVSMMGGITDIELTAICDENNLGLPKGTVVAHWSADFEPPIPEYAPGQIFIGNGRIDLNIRRLRGIGLGSLLMRPIILWIKERPSVPVAPINLSVEDAQSENSKNIRNRFYEKLGFRFDYKDGGTWGDSLSINSHNLVTPEARMSQGWTAVSIVIQPPGEFDDHEIDDLVALVIAGGEVSNRGLISRVMKAHCLAFMRRNDRLIGIAALKRPELSYRPRVAKGAGIAIPREPFEFELGWVFIVPNERGKKLSFPLCESLVRAADNAGIFATSRASNVGMHATMQKLGFSRIGSEWASKQVSENLQLFAKNPSNS